MYIPSYFEIKDKGEIYDIIAENGFATLFSQHNGTPFATHLPLMIDKELKVLVGHMARPNPQWKDIVNQEVLVVFQGPHCYISPSWYETVRAVPTWNYVAVHVYGQVEITDDEQELMGSLDDLVKKYEGSSSSYKLDEVDVSYIEGLSKGIVGFKIKINKIEAKGKLSQNHPLVRQQRVIQQLEQIGSEDTHQIAQLMKHNIQIKSDSFND